MRGTGWDVQHNWLMLMFRDQRSEINASDQHVPLFLLLVWEIMGWGDGELAIAAHLTDATNSAVRTFLRPILLPLFCDGSLNLGVSVCSVVLSVFLISCAHAHSSSVHPLAPLPTTLTRARSLSSFSLLLSSCSRCISLLYLLLHTDVQASCEKKWSSLLCDAPVPRSKGLQAEQVFPTPVVPRAQPA